MEKYEVPIRLSGMHQGSRIKVFYFEKSDGNSKLVYSGSVNVTGTVEFIWSVVKGSSVAITVTHPGFFTAEYNVPVSLDFGVDYNVKQLVDVWAIREAYKRLRGRTEAFIFSGVIAILAAYVITHI